MLEGSPRGERGITRRRFLLAAGGTLLAGGVAALGSYGYAREVEPRWLAVEHVALPLPNLSPALAGFKVVLMGDFHLHPFTQLDLVHRAVRLIARLQPDLILLVGDYVLASAQSIWELAPLLATMSARYGIMAVLGNHDLWTDADLVGRGLEQAGISLLVNQGRSIAVGGEALYVAGLDDGWSGHPDLERALAGRPEGAPVLLLIHEPDFADLWAQDGRVAVQLSGHSHGGQVRLPGCRSAAPGAQRRHQPPPGAPARHRGAHPASLCAKI